MNRAYIFVPWIVNGGADFYLIDLLQRLQPLFQLKIYSEGPVDKMLLAGIRYTLEEVNTGIFSSSACEGYRRSADIVIIHGSSFAYHHIASISLLGRIFDILHNNSIYGHISASVKNKSYITYWIVANECVQKTLTDHDINDNNIIQMNYVPCVEAWASPEEQDERRLDKLRNYTKLVFIGRLSFEKQPLLTIELIDNLLVLDPKVNYQISIIGDGPLANDLQKEVLESIHKDRFVQHGFVNRIEIGMHMLEAHVLINLSSCEGSPLTFAESFCWGLPVFTLQAGGQSPLIDKSNSVVSAGVSEMASRIVELKIHENTDQYLRLCTSARDTYKIFAKRSENAFIQCLNRFLDS